MNYSGTKLEEMKMIIERMPKAHQIEVLKILKKNPMTKLNENKSGVYVNISFLSEETVVDLQEYIKYIKDQETTLNLLETQKDAFKNTFFSEKENKEETILYSSINK
jgi:hypothetical protein